MTTRAAAHACANCEGEAPDTCLMNPDRPPAVRTCPTRFAVSLLPEDFPDGDMWAVTVEYRGAGLWAVLHRTKYLGTDGTWSYGYQWEDGRDPVGDAEIDAYNAGEDTWRATHRFDQATAIKLAEQAARTVEVGRRTAAQALADAKNEEA